VQLSPLVRFWFDEDLCKQLRASLQRVRLVGRHNGRGVARPTSRSAAQSNATGRERQRDLNCVVGVQISRFAGQSNPEATAAPQ
jgi:hypothetical protein